MAWKIYSLGAVAAAALSGCVADEATQQAAKQSAERAYSECLMAAVNRLDDGHSDPASIAMGVAGACSGQYAQLSLQMQSEIITDTGQAYLRDQMRSNELRLATTAVLTYRASKREK